MGLAGNRNDVADTVGCLVILPQDSLTATKRLTEIQEIMIPRVVETCIPGLFRLHRDDATCHRSRSPDTFDPVRQMRSNEVAEIVGRLAGRVEGARNPYNRSRSTKARLSSEHRSPTLSAWKRMRTLSQRPPSCQTPSWFRPLRSPRRGFSRGDAVAARENREPRGAALLGLRLSRGEEKTATIVADSVAWY